MNLESATAAELIKHAASCAGEMYPRDLRDAFLIDQLKVVIEQLVAQRDRMNGKESVARW